jgi:hypothetical protein
LVEEYGVNSKNERTTTIFGIARNVEPQKSTSQARPNGKGKALQKKHDDGRPRFTKAGEASAYLTHRTLILSTVQHFVDVGVFGLVGTEEKLEGRGIRFIGGGLLHDTGGTTGDASAAAGVRETMEGIAKSMGIRLGELLWDDY